ncbi:MAG: hypothetical protein JWQ09_3656 [Segetibacter sp.]|nr:hypothetical protein [Segetibacter sp.]
MKYLLFIILVLSVNCRESFTSKTKRIGEPDIYSIKDDDKEMNAAIEKARETIPDFREALNRQNPGYSNFSVKVKISTQNDAEHIWISNIEDKNGQFMGIVDNLPALSRIKIGDTINVDNLLISDWMYLDKTKLRGGYTIRVLRNRMTAKERKAFDSENRFIIEEKSGAQQ